MKRRTLKFMACAAVMALTLSVTACGGSNDGAKTSDTNTVADTVDTSDVSEPEEEELETEPEAEEIAEPETEEEAVTEPEAEEDGAGEFSTLEDYYNSPGIKEQMDQLASSMASDGVDMTVEVSGNEFFIIAKYEDSSVVVDGIGDAIDQMMESVASVFEDMAASFDEAIGQEGACTVTVRYTGPDGTVLSENSYKAN